MGSFGTSIPTGGLSAAEPLTANREWLALLPWQALRRSRRAVAGLFLVLLIILLAALAPVIGRHDPTYGDFEQTLAAPTADHPAGTDGFGRDVLARVLYGYRVSIVVAFASVIAAVALGLPLGMLAGYFGGLADNLIMRPLDLLMAFPAILLAVALIAVAGTGTEVVALALAIIYLPIMARVLRGSVISARGEEYVDAAHAIGATPGRVMLRHIMPNSIGPLVVQASISMGIAILIEASLSFIGLGTQPPNPSLGSMLAEGRDFMRQAPWVVIFPGLAIMLAVLSFNLLGDGLHELISPARR
jgi:peptide/nickel transport system permease protein